MIWLSTQARLFAEMGFEGLFFARIDYKDKVDKWKQAHTIKEQWIDRDGQDDNYDLAGGEKANTRPSNDVGGGRGGRCWQVLTIVMKFKTMIWMTLTNIFPGQYSLGLLMSTTAIPKGSAGIFSVQMNPSTTTLSKSCLWCQTLILIALNSGVKAQNLFIPTVQPGGLERWSQGCPVWELCERPSSFLQRPGQNRYNKLFDNFINTFDKYVLTWLQYHSQHVSI